MPPLAVQLAGHKQRAGQATLLDCRNLAEDRELSTGLEGGETSLDQTQLCPEGHCRCSDSTARQRQGSLQRKSYPVLVVTDTTIVLARVKAALMLTALTTFPAASFYITSVSLLAPSFLSACIWVRDEDMAVFAPPG